MSLSRKDGTPMQRSIFLRAFLSTESKVALMSLYATFSDLSNSR